MSLISAGSISLDSTFKKSFGFDKSAHFGSRTYSVRSACKLRARRTEYKSVFFFIRHKLLAKVRAYLA